MQSKIQDYIFWKSREWWRISLMILLRWRNSKLLSPDYGGRTWLKIDLKGLKNFQHNPRSDRFCSFVTSVFRQFEELEDEYCTEQEVKDYVRGILQEIQPYL
jgi:hypothetical protein